MSANKFAKRLEERAQAETDLHRDHAESAAASLTPPQRVMLEARNAGISRGGFVLGGTQLVEQCRLSFGRGSRMLGEAMLQGHSPSIFAAASSTEPWSPEPEAAAYAPAKPTWRICSLGALSADAPRLRFPGGVQRLRHFLLTGSFQLHCQLADGTFRPPRREARTLLSEIPYQGPVALAVTEALQAYSAVIAHPATSVAELDAARHRLQDIEEHHHALSLFVTTTY